MFEGLGGGLLRFVRLVPPPSGAMVPIWAKWPWPPRLWFFWLVLARMGSVLAGLWRSRVTPTPYESVEGAWLEGLK